jgi:hypothetical protein
MSATPTDFVMEPLNQRELTRQLNQSHGAYELVFSPIILGLIGMWADAKLHTGHWIAIVTILLGAIGATVKLVSDYRVEMAAHAKARLSHTTTDLA